MVKKGRKEGEDLQTAGFGEEQHSTLSSHSNFYKDDLFKVNNTVFMVSYANYTGDNAVTYVPS